MSEIDYVDASEMIGGNGDLLSGSGNSSITLAVRLTEASGTAAVQVRAAWLLKLLPAVVILLVLRLLG